MSYKQKIQSEIKKAIGNSINNVLIERTKLTEHGDVATNIAMILAKEEKRNPIDIANEIKAKITTDDNLISHIQVAKPGFLNFIVGDYALAESLVEALHTTPLQPYGFVKPKSKEKILIEYVSANPTGDLHIGHGRQAVIGSCLVNLLQAAGNEAGSEFYINDYGEQISNLSETAWAIYKKLQGENIEWKEDFYPEEILKPYVKKIVEACHGKPSEDLTKEILTNQAKDLILKSQKKLLSSFKVDFDKWFSESELHKRGDVQEIINKLKEKKLVYEQEGALWFKAKDFGDIRDRVLIRSDSRPTYLLADIAYHVDKFKRGYNYLITVWGADHHGQEISLRASLKALGFDDKKLEIIFVQLVSLKQGGQEVKMSKRTGAFVTVEEVLSEVGADAFRYFLIESHANNRMVFDIDLAKKQDKDNPVYYIQYAHARCCSIFRQAGAIPELTLQEQSCTPDVFMNLFKANNKEYGVTKALILRILDFPEEVIQAVETRSPNRIANYLKDLATDFHSFYTICRVITKDINLTKARLGLIQATKITITNGLKILGVTAPEAM